MWFRNDPGNRMRTDGWVLALVVSILLSAGTAAAQDVHDYVPESGDNLACTLCHTCEFPTHSDMCLRKDVCLRSRGAGFQNGLPRETVMVLDEMEKVYDPVYFSHEKHAQMSEMSGGCENCHHFMPATQGHPACLECHAPVAANSKIQPGLKAAYHRQCLDCHAEWDTETHCEWCHRKKRGGMSEAELANLPNLIHEAPLEVKDLILFETAYEEGGIVPFHHLNHVELYNRDCSICHKDERCASCHVHGGASHPMGLLSEIDLHDTCYQCHDKERGCDECHGRNSNDLFDHADVGWPLEAYHKVLQCKDCHHIPGKYEANDPRCVTCHFDGFDEKHFNHGVTGVVLDDVHLDTDCSDCHTEGFGVHTTCDNCHDDGRVWQRHASFGPGLE